MHGAPCPVAIVPADFEQTAVAVVGVAFLPSPEGREALHAGATLARAASAKLRVVAMLKPEFGSVESAHADTRGVRENVRREDSAASHEETMRAAIADALAGVPEVADVQVDVEFAEPEQSFVDLSRHLGILVMGSRGLRADPRRPARRGLSPGVGRGGVPGARGPPRRREPAGGHARPCGSRARVRWPAATAGRPRPS